MKFWALNLLAEAMNTQYAQLMPEGFTIHLIDEYRPNRYPAPNLWMEKKEKPNAKYIVILTSDTRSVPALGETVADAIGWAISKIEKEAPMTTQGDMK